MKFREVTEVARPENMGASEGVRGTMFLSPRYLGASELIQNKSK
jgi:hypothetical protein